MTSILGRGRSLWQRWRVSVNPVSGGLLLCLWLSVLFFVVAVLVRGLSIVSLEGLQLLGVAAAYGASVTAFALRQDLSERVILPSLLLLPLMAYLGHDSEGYIAIPYGLLLGLLAARLPLRRVLFLTVLFYVSFLAGSYANARAYDLTLDRGWLLGGLFLALMLVVGVNHLVGVRQRAEVTAGNLEASVGALRRTAAHLRQQWEQLLHLNKQLLALHEIARTINQTSADVESTLQRIADLSVQVMGLSVCTISLTAEDGRTWSGVAASQPHHEMWRRQGGRVNGASTVGQVILSRQPVVATDAEAQDEDRRRLAQGLAVRSFMVLPLQVRDEVKGAVLLGTQEEHPFSAEEVDLARSLADHVAIVIDNARLMEGERRKARQLAELHRLATALTSEVEPDNILGQVADMACLLLRAPACSVLMVDEGQRMLVCRISRGDARGFPLPQSLPLAAGLGDGRRAAYHIIEEVWHDRSERGRGDVRSVLLVPLEHRGRLLGLLSIYRDGDGRSFGDDDVELAQTLAAHASTSLVKAELLRQAAEVEAIREAERLKTEFVSVVSHELRTPLTTIVGMSELLRDFPVTPQQGREMAEAIHREGRRLTRLIDDLLDMGRLEEGRLALRLGELDLAALLHELQAQAAVFAPHHVVQVAVEPSLPPVRGDADRVRQIMFNLLSNAAHYSPQGSTIRIEAKMADGFAQVSVADQGVGIAAEEIPRIFDKFYRGRGANPGAAAGAGLGLYITKSLVEMHGGHITVESEVNHGSTFTFTLPLAYPHQELRPTV